MSSLYLVIMKKENFPIKAVEAGKEETTEFNEEDYYFFTSTGDFVIDFNDFIPSMKDMSLVA